MFFFPNMTIKKGRRGNYLRKTMHIRKHLLPSPISVSLIDRSILFVFRLICSSYLFFRSIDEIKLNIMFFHILKNCKIKFSIFS